jgi:hypothetical protein
MTGGSAAKTVDLDMTGVRRLTLGVTDTGNDLSSNRNAYDHSDWANALVIVTNSTPRPPPAPAGLAASSGNAVTLTWNTTLAALGYNVKRSTQSGGPYTNIAGLARTVFADTNVALGTTYYYVVSATNLFGEGSSSTQVAVVPCALPNVPANLSTSVSNSQMTLRWSPVAGALSYTIARFTSSTSPATIATGLTTTNFTDTPIAPGTTNYYLVAAVNACNQGAYSAFVPAVVPPLNIGPLNWNGGSLTGSFWTDSNNWSGVPSIIPTIPLLGRPMPALHLPPEQARSRLRATPLPSPAI